MDCSTARLFLQFGRPGAQRELGAEEAAELEAHLALCTNCQQFDLDQRRLDAALGQAIRDVEVPPGLKEQILLRLAAERGPAQRRWGGRVFLTAAAAAAVLLIGLGLWVYFSPLRPTIAASDVARDYNIAGRERDSVNAQLKKLGLPACAPRFVNYVYLTGSPAKALLPGTEEWKNPVEVAQLVFAYRDHENKDHRAVVFAVPRRSAIIEQAAEADAGYTYSLGYDASHASFVYLILHTGKNWDWLKVADEE